MRKLSALERVPRWVWWASGGLAAAGVLGYVGITYKGGKATGLTLLKKIDGVPITFGLAERFEAMRRAAAADGVRLKLNSAFRSNAEQMVLWVKSLLPGAPVAAKPGYSNHQSGTAADIETGGTNTATYAWLTANAGRFGFKRTVSSEPWHWELV